MSEKFVSKAMDENGVGLMFRELCRWEVEVSLVWLPMAQRHLDWITWSLMYLEEHVELPTGAVK
jgi:hypothetical protein